MHVAVPALDVVRLFAQSPGSDNSLAEYGILGAVVAAIVGAMGWVFRWALTGERARGDRLETVVLELNTYMRDRMVPALEQTSASNAEVARSNAEVAKVLAQVVMLLHDRRSV